VRLINFFPLLLVIALASLSSCSGGGSERSEGVITYGITYPVPLEDKWMERLMPKEMEMQFKDGLLKTELSFAVGMIKIAFLSDQKNKKLYELMKFMKKKNYATRNQDEVNLMMNSIPPHKITPGNATKMIAGYTCKNAMVEVKNDTINYEFELWYTEELGSKDLNWCSPFSPIQGVLMEYQIERFDVTMKFTAKNVDLEEFPEDEFLIPENYKKISYQEMRENLEQLKDI
jgi:hypothetical protein